MQIRKRLRTNNTSCMHDCCYLKLVIHAIFIRETMAPIVIPFIRDSISLILLLAWGAFMIKYQVQFISKQDATVCYQDIICRYKTLYRSKAPDLSLLVNPFLSEIFTIGSCIELIHRF